MASPSSTSSPRDSTSLWRATTALSCAAGLLAAWWQLGTRGFLVCLAFTTALALCLVLAVQGPGATRTSWARITVLAGLLSTAGLGLTTALGVPGLAWIVLLAAMSPRGRKLWRKWFPARQASPGRDRLLDGMATAPPPTEPRAAPEPPTAVGDLDDEALCLAWRRSFVQLRQATTVAGRLQQVEQRQRLLDELERRDAAGLSAWLASGARAAGNPLPYLSRPRSS